MSGKNASQQINPRGSGQAHPLPFLLIAPSQYVGRSRSFPIIIKSWTPRECLFPWSPKAVHFHKIRRVLFQARNMEFTHLVTTALSGIFPRNSSTHTDDRLRSWRAANIATPWIDYRVFMQKIKEYRGYTPVLAVCKRYFSHAGLPS